MGIGFLFSVMIPFDFPHKSLAVDQINKHHDKKSKESSGGSAQSAASRTICRSLIICVPKICAHLFAIRIQHICCHHADNRI